METNDKKKEQLVDVFTTNDKKYSQTEQTAGP
jgi:hypothetical protein